MTAGERAAPLLVGAMIGSMVAGRFETVGACVAVALGAGIALRMRPPSRAWIGTVVIGIVVAFVLNLVLIPGRTLWALPFGRRATIEGARRGALLALRLCGATIAVQGLRAAWPGERTPDELARALRPLSRLRVPIAEARTLVALAMRFAPLLADETRRIARLQDLRAGRPPRDFRERLTRRRAVLVPALVSALERADRVALALEARHYRVRPISSAPVRVTGWSISGMALAMTALLWRG